MSGLEPGPSGIGRERSTNWPPLTSRSPPVPLLCTFQGLRLIQTAANLLRHLFAVQKFRNFSIFCGNAHVYCTKTHQTNVV